jgi:nicotinamidase/pyrazinamidase
MSLPELEPTDALLIVDVQNDFCSGGALPVEEGDRVIPVLNLWIEAAQKYGAKILASRDWHPPDHISFREYGGPWPTHCVQNTWGAAFHPALNLPGTIEIVTKGDLPNRDNYSDFEGTGLAEELAVEHIRRLWIGGLALDVCVRATVLDALRAGFEVHLIKAGTRALNVHPGDGERVLQELQQAGCIVEESPDHA